MRFSPLSRRVMAGAVLGGIGCLAFLSLLPLHPVSAQSQAAGAAELSNQAARMVCLRTGPIPSVCPPDAIAEAQRIIDEKIAQPSLSIAVATAIINTLSYIGNRAAYESAVWIASGGKGQGALTYDTKA